MRAKSFNLKLINKNRDTRYRVYKLKSEYKNLKKKIDDGQIETDKHSEITGKKMVKYRNNASIIMVSMFFHLYILLFPHKNQYVLLWEQL